MTRTTALDPNDAYGTAIAADTVRLERLLPGPVERVWSYLTDPELRALWFAGGSMALRVGGPVALEFHNNALTPDDDPPPPEFAGAAEPYRMHGIVTLCDPPYRLGYTWSEESGHPSEVRFELAPQGRQVRLVITHTRLTSSGLMLGVSAGWHTHVAILIARLSGHEPPKFWRTFTRLRAEYAARA
jgi:uncharacterized protein YndB with AHSA1/START domain